MVQENWDDALLFLALVMVAPDTGLFAMRAPTDSELDAMEAEAVYDDLEVVEGLKDLSASTITRHRQLLRF